MLIHSINFIGNILMLQPWLELSHGRKKSPHHQETASTEIVLITLLVFEEEKKKKYISKHSRLYESKIQFA